MTLLAYRFALDPTPAQDRLLRSHCGAARAAYNRGLAHVRAVTAAGNRNDLRRTHQSSAPSSPASSGPSWWKTCSSPRWWPTTVSPAMSRMLGLAVNGRGGEGVLALPVKRQPGTAQAGSTGTVQPQGRTALRELTRVH